MLKIALVIIQGDLADVDLTCPYCQKESLIFSFTVIEHPRYGLFIVCRDCHRSVIFRPIMSQRFSARVYRVFSPEVCQ